MGYSFNLLRKKDKQTNNITNLKLKKLNSRFIEDLTNPKDFLSINDFNSVPYLVFPDNIFEFASEKKIQKYYEQR